MLLRRDIRGISSIVSTLRLKPKCYDNLIHFFRSTAYELKDLKRTWIKSVEENADILMVNDYSILIGDNIKVAKEAKKMPAVKRLHQDSDNSGKAEYISGHNHGVIGVLAQSNKNLSCIPVLSELQEGVNQIKDFTPKQPSKGFQKYTKRDPEKPLSIVEKMVYLASEYISTTGRKSVLLLDAFFATGSAFDAAAINKLLVLIVRAKKNFVAYHRPTEKDTNRKGRSKKYGEKVSFEKFFDAEAEQFKLQKVSLYGKKETIEYCCMDLLWKSASDLIRFVLVKHNSNNFILMCSDITIDPLTIIELYSYRFKIEVTFKSLKNTMGCFFYHFWCKVMPKLSRKTTETNLSLITDIKDKQSITNTLKAIEVFVFLGCMATGILQMIALKYPKTVWAKYSGWLRTRKSETVSIETVRFFLQEELLWNFYKVNDYATLKIIKNLQRDSLFLYNEEAS